MEKEFNPVIKAVQSLRKIAVEIKSTNKEIHENDQAIRLKINEAGKLMAATNNSMVVNKWIREKAQVVENSNTLLGILESIEVKFKNKDIKDILEVWKTHEHYKVLVLNGMNELKEAGTVILGGGDLLNWEGVWKNIEVYLNNILSISETYNLKFRMMLALEPEEVDTLTMDIIQHIPLNYSDEEAGKYEKEYLLAYNELKESQSKKKSIWDKLMDVLAGGIEETPAHRVQMRRWMDGNED